MPQFTSRTSWNTEANELSRQVKNLRDQNKTIWDLTVSNPTKCGFRYLASDLLKTFSDPRNLSYDPDPKGLLETRKLISAYYAKRGLQVDPDQIIITANTSEAYSFLFKLLFEQADVLLAPQPSYPLMDYLASLNDVRMKRYALDANRGWRIQLPQVPLPKVPGSKTLNLALLEGVPRAVLVVNPNNPTGNYVHAEERTELNRFCAERDLAVISDEVFWDYPIETSQSTPADRVSFADNQDVLTFTLSGVSKVLGLPQMKLSWIVVSGPEKICREAAARLEIISDTFLSASTPSQNALKDWLEKSESIQDEIRSRISMNYAEACRVLSGSPVTVSPIEGGWHIPIQLPGPKSDEEWASLFLKSEQVLTHPGYLFDFTESHFLVLSLLTPENIFKEGVSKILNTVCRGAITPPFSGTR